MSKGLYRLQRSLFEEQAARLCFETLGAYFAEDEPRATALVRPKSATAEALEALGWEPILEHDGSTLYQSKRHEREEL